MLTTSAGAEHRDFCIRNALREPMPQIKQEERKTGAMYQTTVRIDGMMCGMCESHVNDAIRTKLTVKKVSSSHKKGETVIISENELTAEMVTAALDGSGYQVLNVTCGPYEKKGFFRKK